MVRLWSRTFRIGSTPFYTQYSQSLVKLTTHFLGSGRHWEKWEIADIAFILEVYLLSAKSGERPNFNRLPELVDPNTYV